MHKKQKQSGLLILASSSKARAAILRDAGIRFIQQPAALREPRPRRAEKLGAYIARTAMLKAQAAALCANSGDWILAADTAVAFKNKIMGKPGTVLCAKRMLRSLQGRTHMLGTAICLLAPCAPSRARRVFQGMDMARISLRRMTPSAIDAYVAAKKPLACAGAYALQGGGAAVVRKMIGDPSTVIGLPLSLAETLLRKAGFPNAKADTKKIRQP